MVDGLILLGFIALMLALVSGRLRRRLGMTYTGRIMAMSVAFFAIAILVLWAVSRR